MFFVGIDVSKGKSTVCVMDATSNIVIKPYEIMHTRQELDRLCECLNNLQDYCYIVMESTGHYHLPVAVYLSMQGFHVTAENALLVKKFFGIKLHGGKTDSLDAKKIALYGLLNKDRLRQYQYQQDIYEELKILLNQYFFYMELYVSTKNNLINLMDRTMPGIKQLLDSNSQSDFKKIKYKDFALEYKHLDAILKMNKKEFTDSYEKWCKEKGYHFNLQKAHQLYKTAEDGIPTLPSDSSTTLMLTEQAAQQLTHHGAVLNSILSQMKKLAKTLPEYSVISQMGGIGEKLAPCIIAAIGRVDRFYSSKALVAYAGIDAPPYQSGQFQGNRRKIGKRGSKNIRRVGYMIMKSLKSHPPCKDRAVYDFIIKKEKEGKPKKVAKIAGLNKFLHIYYARVTELYQQKVI